MARCKKCKEKFLPTRFLQKFCGETIECKTAEGLSNLLEIQKQKQKDWNKTKEVLRPQTHSKENKAELQRMINKLARLIDLKFGYKYCIDCGNPYGNQQDAGHFNSVGHNSSLRWNLHNIHSQASNCNRNGMGGGKQLGYFRGLEKRYGTEYAEFVEVGLQKKYSYIGLKENEIYDKLKLVRSIVKHFDTYDFKDSLHARDMFNKLIGIYEGR